MGSSAEVYCIRCKQVMERERAHVVFKTGYYKLVFQLAICCACSRAAD
jgi:NAD-dependent SIR2 family protein deacetylase